jgi:hypothetical protein
MLELVGLRYDYFLIVYFMIGNVGRGIGDQSRLFKGGN